MMPWATFTIVSAQAPSAVILVRAERFRPNHATAADNAFQTDAPAGQSDEETATKALAEMDAVARALRSAGVRVHVFSDEDHLAQAHRDRQALIDVHAGLGLLGTAAARLGERQLDDGFEIGPVLTGGCRDLGHGECTAD